MQTTKFTHLVTVSSQKSQKRRVTIKQLVGGKKEVKSIHEVIKKKKDEWKWTEDSVTPIMKTLFYQPPHSHCESDWLWKAKTCLGSTSRQASALNTNRKQSLYQFWRKTDTKTSTIIMKKALTLSPLKTFCDVTIWW